MKKFILLFFISVQLSLLGQGDNQQFKNAGFKVNCNCNLRVNSLFIEMARAQGTNVIAAYICAENEGSTDYGVIYNINIYDESDKYRGVSQNNFAYFEKKYLESYARQLSNNNMPYRYINYKGVSALEYTFEQYGLPTKAIMFLRNKKSYLLQVGARKHLADKFNGIINSFGFL